MSGSGAGGRRITIRSISCRGVRAFVPFQKPPLYAAVSLGGRREKTQPDAKGGENPDWDDAVFAFDLDGDGAQLVEFEVKAQVPILGNKLVGTASVPVPDLVAAGGRGVSYQVSAPDGKPNGTLSFAYAMSGGPGAAARPQPQLKPAPGGARPDQNQSFCCAPQPSAAYPPPARGAANLEPPQPSPPASASLYPPLEGLLSPRSHPPPPPPYPQFPAPNNSNYPPPPASCPAAPAEFNTYPPPLTAAATAYPPPPPASCAGFPAPPGHYSSYPPPPSTNYPPAPPGQYSSYPPPPSTNYPPALPSGYPPPTAYNSTPTTTSTYPPPPESGSFFPIYPRSAPSPQPGTADRALPYYPAPQPPGGSFYPPPENYPPPGSRYP